MSGTDAIKIDPKAGTVDGEKTATGPVREEVRAQNSDSDSTSEPVPASNAAAPDVDDVGSEGTDESTEALQLDADEAEAIAGLLLSGLVLDDGATLAKPPAPLPAPSRPRLESFDLAGVAGLIAAGQVKRIVCMCGAGISVAAGIPDFRTPGTGLYSRLAEYQLPHPEAVFDMDFFRRNPQPFFLLAKELFPGTYAPTLTHHFMRLLHDKRLLHRCYTQNIDSLEHLAGLPKEAVIAAHGNFDSARCIDCKAVHDVEYVKNAVDAQTPCFCAADKSYKKGCKGLVKPDIVFFGEGLPDRFWRSMNDDFEAADLLIVLGTSLVVQPFASLIDKVNHWTPRLLINRERVGEADPIDRLRGFNRGFNFGKGNQRDALYEGDCDDGVRQLCALLGWEEELETLAQAWGKQATEEAQEDAGTAAEQKAET